MLGPLANSAALIIGGLGGAVLGRRLPRRVRETLPLTFGIIAAAIGTTLMNKVHALPAVALALILGSLAGELAHLERGLEKAIGWAQRQAERLMPGEKGNPRVEGFVGKFVTLLVLFCASGMGIFGATQEGMTGDAHILLAKSILDLFTALIFAAELGPAVALICLPQLLVQGGLFLGAGLLVPLATPEMLADFSACGGVIMMATGLRICGIKFFPIVNMLPALFLAMPCSLLWGHFFG